MWKSQENLLELVLFFHEWVPGIGLLSLSSAAASIPAEPTHDFPKTFSLLDWPLFPLFRTHSNPSPDEFLSHFCGTAENTLCIYLA